MPIPTPPPTTTERLECMEVWGGNQAIDTDIVADGLDAWIYSLPWHGDVAGGDVHYLSCCATGRVTRVLVADVSGHGNAVAATAIDLRDLMRRYVNHLDQRSFLVALNRSFVEAADVGRFATSIALTFFAPTGVVDLCNLGHPPAFVRRGQTGRWESVRDADGQRTTNIPLGIADAETFEQMRFRLDPDDTLLCYTDSLMEALDETGRMLGVDGLLAVVNSIEAPDPPTFISALRTELQSRHPDNLNGDDVTILVLKPNGAGTKVSLGRRFTAPLRLVAGIVGAVLSRSPVPLPEISLTNIGGAMFNRFNRSATLARHAEQEKSRAGEQESK